MPGWAQAVLWAAALATALAALWTKVMRPGARLIAMTERMLPLLVELTAVFAGTPTAFRVLDEIASQFRTDSGSSLRDVVNRLDQAAADNHAAGEALRIQVDVVKDLAAQDRAQLARLVVALDRLTRVRPSTPASRK